MRRLGIYAALIFFLGGLAVSWLTHGTGVIHDDPKKNISVPTLLTVPLQVQAAYNGTDAFFRYRWPSPNAGIFHDVLRFTNGAWAVRGSAVPGSQPDGLHEDRVAVMLDDGSVPEFARYGGYVAIGHRLAGFSDEVSGREIREHAYLGKKPGGRLVCLGVSALSTGRGRAIAHAACQLVQFPWFWPIRLMNDNRAVAGVNLGRL